MRPLGTLAGLLTCASAVLGMVMTVRRDRMIRRAFEAGKVSAANQVPEGVGAKVLRVGAIVAFIILVLAIAIVFLASLVQNAGSF